MYSRQFFENFAHKKLGNILQFCIRTKIRHANYYYSINARWLHFFDMECNIKHAIYHLIKVLNEWRKINAGITGGMVCVCVGGGYNLESEESFNFRSRETWKLLWSTLHSVVNYVDQCYWRCQCLVLVDNNYKIMFDICLNMNRISLTSEFLYIHMRDCILIYY